MRCCEVITAGTFSVTSHGTLGMCGTGVWKQQEGGWGRHSLGDLPPSETGRSAYEPLNEGTGGLVPCPVLLQSGLL